MDAGRISEAAWRRAFRRREMGKRQRTAAGRASDCPRRSFRVQRGRDFGAGREMKMKAVISWLRTALNICAAFAGKSKCPFKAADDRSRDIAQEIRGKAEARTVGL